MSAEKMPYPPAYSDVYPNISQTQNSSNEGNNVAGWRQETAEDTTPINPTSSTTQPPAYGSQTTVPTQILENRSRVGLYPIQLSPCPHCLKHEKTFVTYDTTLKTHLFALILCVACCWCCAPLPYITKNATKTCSHFCSNCSAYIGSFVRNPFRWS